MAAKDIPIEKFEDYAKVCQNNGIMKQLDGAHNEKVMFSCFIHKQNKYGFNQERTLLITNSFIYNIDGKKIQRMVPITSIAGFTRSDDPKNYTFIVHFENLYDYEFSVIEKKYGMNFVNKIRDVVQYVFAKTMNYNLPVYSIGKTDKFETYTTTKKDQTDGFDRLPNEYPFRKKDQNRYKTIPADKHEEVKP